MRVQHAGLLVISTIRLQGFRRDYIGLTMPVADLSLKTSTWADEVEEGEEESAASRLPPVQEIKGDTKIVTEYDVNEDGKQIKIIRHFKVEKRIVSKSIAQRKLWKKFGQSRNDQPGPNPATTVVAEDVFMQFLTGREDNDKNEQDPLDKLKQQGKMVKCRICKDDHWTTQCPYKDSLAPLQDAISKINMDEKKPAAVPPTEEKQTNKYVAPGLRDGGNRRGESMQTSRRGDETAAIRVSNLSENTQEKDLDELFKPFGRISRIYLAKDKHTGICKGFAFINFFKREDAAKAIHTLHGYGYDHLILQVEWSKPSGTQ